MCKRDKKLFFAILLVFLALMLLCSLLLCLADPSMSVAAAASLVLLIGISLWARWDIRRP